MASGTAPAPLVSVPLEPLPPPSAATRPDGRRLDGRGLEEFRGIFLDTRVVSRAAGSAYVELGATKVMAAIYGPRQSERRFGFSDRGRLNCEVSFTSLATRERSKQALRASRRELSAALAAALGAVVDVSRFPKAAVDVMVLVLQADGGELPAAVVAASAALADAGIEQRDLLPACGVARVGGGELLLDPGPHEAARASGSVMVAYAPGCNRLAQLQATGAWSGDELRRALELAMGGCLQLRGLMRETLLAAAEAAAAAGAAGAEAAAGGGGGRAERGGAAAT